MEPIIETAGYIPKPGELGFFLFGHQCLIAIVLDHCHDPADTRFAVNEPPRKTADGDALVQEEIDIPTHTLRMDDAAVKHLNMHELVLII